MSNSNVVRMAIFLCIIEGVSRRVRLCATCHGALREHISSTYKIAGRVSCDSCTPKGK